MLSFIFDTHMANQTQDFDKQAATGLMSSVERAPTTQPTETREEGNGKGMSLFSWQFTKSSMLQPFYLYRQLPFFCYFEQIFLMSFCYI